MRSTLAVRVVDRLFIVAYGTAAPSDPEWTSYLELVRRHGVDRTAQLVLTDGGAPGPTQRRRLNELLAGRLVPVAVVSGSARVRVAVTGLSLFNRGVRAFPPSGLREAVAYLEVPSSRLGLIERGAAELRASLSAP